MTTIEKLGKRYWLQLREEENAVRLVEYIGKEPWDGDELILLQERTKDGVEIYPLKKSAFGIDWRTWNRPPLLEWVRRPWKEQNSICRE